MRPLIFSKCTFIKIRFPNLVQTLNSRIAPTYFLENENVRMINLHMFKNELLIFINYLFKYLFNPRINTLTTL